MMHLMGLFGKRSAAVAAACGILLAAPASQATSFGSDWGDWGQGSDGWDGWNALITSVDIGHGSIISIDDLDLSLFNQPPGSYDTHLAFGWDFDLRDLRHWKRWRDWRNRGGQGGEPIPEPGAALVFGAGLLVVGAATRRRR